MRILVLSDSHGSFKNLDDAIEDQPSAKTVIFLGDGEDELDDLRAAYPDITFYAVKGNCDLVSDKKTVEIIDIAGHRIYATHGHAHYVKMGDGRLRKAARAAGADIALYGHTHVPLCDYEDGLYVMNPGSVTRPAYGSATYGYIDITSAGVVTAIVKL